MTKRRKTRRFGPRTPAQRAWASSERFRSMGSAMMKRFNNLRRAGPKCGARTKIDGHPCQNPAMANGRCRVHGGNTPKGDGWHRPLWPDRNSPRVNEKLARKLAQLERAARKRERLLAAMSPEKRAAYQRWKSAHKPGSAAAREMRRKERRDAASFQDRSNQPEPPRSSELIALDLDIELMRAKIAQYKVELNAFTDDEGVLG